MKDGDITGIIFDIQRFSVHDGPGIRTCVFMKGCPLSCLWCHNPESMAKEPEIAYYPDKCYNCGACAAVCPRNCHRIGQSGRYCYDREDCDRCGLCAKACVFEALAVIGRIITVREAMAEVKRDEVFYRNSGGGLTITGGEPFYQLEFTLALLRTAKEDGLHTCVETSGALSFDILKQAVEVTDIFLYDLKDTSPENHKAYTGVSNTRIIENLMKLDEWGAAITLRCPIIPGVNDNETHFKKLGLIAGQLKNVTHIDIEPYHALGTSKAVSIGKEPWRCDIALVPAEQAEKWAESLKRHTNRIVRIS